MALPKGALKPVLWQLIPKEALHLAIGAGSRVNLGMLYMGRRGGRDPRACNVCKL